jgi:hypothetical protein
MARQLIVVSREDIGLYHALCADWIGDPDVAVVLDRRRGQRRQELTNPMVERRREERRQHPLLEAHLAWSGGGAAARKSHVRSFLSRSSYGVVVCQRPMAKADGRAPLRPPTAEVRDESFDVSMMSAPATTVVALVILIGTLSGGIVGGLALWLFLAYEFAAPRGRQGAATSSRADVFSWWQRPLHKLRRSSRPWSPAEKSGKA